MSDKVNVYRQQQLVRITVHSHRDSMTAENTQEVLITLSVKWEGDKLQPDARKKDLQITLQTQFNRNKRGEYCTVKNVSEDGTVEMSIRPASAISVLEGLTDQILRRKDEKYKIISVGQTPSELRPQKANGDEANVPSLLSAAKCVASFIQDEHSDASIAEDGETQHVLVPLGHFWYVYHIYRQEMKRIEEENGVRIEPEAKVSFNVNQGGNPTKAINDFISLVQGCLGESRVTPEGISTSGPKPNQDIISKCLNQPQNKLMQSNLREESAWVSQNRPQIGMNIEDPFVHGGLSVDERHWKKMNVSLKTELVNIKAKYGVDFEESSIIQGKLTIKVRHTSGVGAASMESHAVRTLLRLYQKIMMSPGTLANLDPDQTKDAAEKLEESNSEDDVRAGASGSSGPQVSWDSGQSQADMDNTEMPTGGGATAGSSTRESKEEVCSICMDSFTNKKQLKCKHEFCQHCLTRAIETAGNICPICREVFGKMQGDQPDGNMSWNISSSPLPGFPGCGTIVITYHIPDGIQTEKHPNPGKKYCGTMRRAYLPDNKEGHNVLQLLRKAFEQKMIFTVGMSRTTGEEDQVTWNDIHHKTNTRGGACYGYPDHNYLKRVTEELKAKGIE
ncbi:E3 ubiquitin-protein ligase DTX3L-like isoform X2 [Thalassophryne amazonica]|uniref:E3 ubiquitin-protein ligase DTX3L-like isoform X2 n=1 Tax=Thalassophryne amazonica TaxID=390379 RepID=UPI00147102F6|nr:E3 ubiquitin-protein ligase DTX3L-like isoform X2 [Thalassophryne amazonica]